MKKDAPSNSGVGANANLNIAVVAQGSQQLVVIFGVLSALAVAAFFYFAWNSHAWTWIPGVSAAALVGVTLWLHGKSRRLLDLVAANDTKVVTDGTNTSITTNAATLGDPDAADALYRLISNLIHRQPLPAPDGVVVAQGIDTSPDARAVALARVQAANLESDQLAQRAVTEIAGQGRAVRQPRIPQPTNMPTGTVQPIRVRASGDENKPDA